MQGQFENSWKDYLKVHFIILINSIKFLDPFLPLPVSSYELKTTCTLLTNVVKFEKAQCGPAQPIFLVCEGSNQELQR